MNEPESRDLGFFKLNFYKMIFETDQFRLEKEFLSLKRKSFVIERISISEISYCEIKPSKVVKRPILLAGFGCLLQIPLIWFLCFWYEVLSQSKFDLTSFGTSQGYHRAIAVQLIVVGFCTFLGVFSLFQAFKKSISMEVKLKDQRTFIFDLGSLQKSNQLKRFFGFLNNLKLIYKGISED